MLQSAERKGQYTVESFAALAMAAHKLVERQYMLSENELTPYVRKAGIKIISRGDRNAAQRAVPVRPRN